MALSVFLQTRPQVETDGSLSVKALLRRSARVRAQLCRTLYDPMDISMPGFPVLNVVKCLFNNINKNND